MVGEYTYSMQQVRCSSLFFFKFSLLHSFTCFKTIFPSVFFFRFKIGDWHFVARRLEWSNIWSYVFMLKYPWLKYLVFLIIILGKLLFIKTIIHIVKIHMVRIWGYLKAKVLSRVTYCEIIFGFYVYILLGYFRHTIGKSSKILEISLSRIVYD